MVWLEVESANVQEQLGPPSGDTSLARLMLGFQTLLPRYGWLLLPTLPSEEFDGLRAVLEKEGLA